MTTNAGRTIEGLTLTALIANARKGVTFSAMTTNAGVNLYCQKHNGEGDGKYIFIAMTTNAGRERRVNF